VPRLEKKVRLQIRGVEFPDPILKVETSSLCQGCVPWF
jgi:hypothetical protein